MFFSCDFSKRGTPLKPANHKWNDTPLQDLLSCTNSLYTGNLLCPRDQLKIKTWSIMLGSTSS